MRCLHAIELFCAEASSHRPFCCFCLARLLGVFKELLVCLKLCGGVVQEHLTFGKLLGLCSRISLLLLQGRLQRCKLLPLGSHEFFEGLLAFSLLCVVLLEIGSESIVHALEYALNLR